MTKVLAIFGATGQQGLSVLKNVVEDPALFKEYNIRAITRNVDSEVLKPYANKIEIVQGDLERRESLEKSLTGVHTVFYVSITYFDAKDAAKEKAEIILAAEIAVEMGVQYFIFSTLSNFTKGSGGKYTKANHSTGKAEAEEHIRGLPIKSAFVSAGGYYQNYQTVPFFTPKKVGTDTWAILAPITPEACLPLIDVAADFGKFVGLILANPAQYEGQVVPAAYADYSQAEVAAVISKNTGKKVIFKQVSMDEYVGIFGDYLGNDFGDTFRSAMDFGYYTPYHQKFLTEPAIPKAKLTSLEDYFARVSFTLSE